MKRKYIIIIVMVSIIILSNITPFRQLLKISVDQRHYRYSNYDGSFTFYEYMDRNFEMMNMSYKTCMSYYPDQKDKKIYRLFTKNPLAFWRWRLYFFDERYKFPYKDWAEIEKVRGNPIKKRTGCIMDF